MITLSSSGRSDIGRVRSNNEDSLLVADDIGLYAVADGVGGRPAGEVASRLAVNTAAAFIRRWRSQPGELDLVEAAQAAAEAACRAVHDEGQANPEHRGMTTTLTLLVVDGESAAMAHVGDSRLYLIRGDRVDRLSADHTIANELVVSGVLTAADAENTPFSRALTRSIGTHATVLVDTLEFELVAGDVIVLSTDGLNAVMKDSARVLELAKAEDTFVDALVDAANAGGGRDNISVVALRPRGMALSSSSAADLLRTVDPFARLSTRGLLSVVATGDIVELAKGEVVLREGQIVDRMVALLDGELTWSVGDKTRTLQVGECMGVSAVFRPSRAPGTLRARTRAQILTLDSVQLDRIAQRRRRLGAAVMRGLGRALSDLLLAKSQAPGVRGF